jgi:NCAIR mutase (PurE)-related protein
VVFCAGKTGEQIVAICEGLNRQAGGFLGTRVTPEQAAALLARFPDARHNPLARTVVRPATRTATHAGSRLLVVSAGTSDLPVAEEAVEVALASGLEVDRLTDVGVAGIHRLLSASKALHQAGVIIVVAGMEGALPSVVGGLVAVPVIAVPTSVGYGASFGGIAALLAMLNSCAAGVTVVNIDNGFGAAVAAFRILHQAAD